MKRTVFPFEPADVEVSQRSTKSGMTYCFSHMGLTISRRILIYPLIIFIYFLLSTMLLC